MMMDYRWPVDDHYNRLRYNTFKNFEEVHHYVVEIGGLAIRLIDELADKYGCKLKPVARDDVKHRLPQDMIGPARHHFFSRSEEMFYFDDGTDCPNVGCKHGWRRRGKSAGLINPGSPDSQKESYK